MINEFDFLYLLNYIYKRIDLDMEYFSRKIMNDMKLKTIELETKYFFSNNHKKSNFKQILFDKLFKIYHKSLYDDIIILYEGLEKKYSLSNNSDLLFKERSIRLI